MQAAESYQARSLNQLLDVESDAGMSRLDRLGAPDPEMDLFTDSHAVAPALAELPDRERSILIMRFYQDMTQTEIAERVGVSQMHISRILAAALAHLRAVVTDTEVMTDGAGAR